MKKILLIIAAIVFCLCFNAIAEVGVTDNEIIIGTCLDADGNSSWPGNDLLGGMKCYFDKVNKAGGISGKKINLVIKDDDYDPAKTAAHVKDLIEKDKVFVLNTLSGTPCGTIAKPLILSSKIPLIGIASGADAFREPPEKYIFNVRGSYAQEAVKLVVYLVEKLKLKKISIIYQNDAYGLPGLRAAMRKLKEYDLALCSKAIYDRGKEIDEEQFNIIKESNPEAVILIAVSKSAMSYFNLAKKNNFKVKVTGISPCDAFVLMDKLGSEADGMLMTQIMPNLDETKTTALKDFSDNIKNFAQKNFMSYEGYLDAKVLCWGMEQCGANLTREELVKKLESLRPGMITSGLEISFDENDRQGAGRIFLTEIKDKKLNWIEGEAFVKTE